MSAFSARVKKAWNGHHLLSVLLELTYSCNLNCAFCYNDLALTGARLTLAEYRTLLRDLAEMGVLNLTLSGGEPLAHPDFFAIGAAARDHGFATRIKSNGHAMRREIAKRVRAEIDPLVIEVSLHGATAETHDRQTRVPGSFERLLQNLRIMREEGLRVRINSTLTRWNEGEVEGMYAIADELGVALQMDSEVKPRDDGDRAPLDIAATPEGHLRWLALRDARAAARITPAEAANPATAPNSPALKAALKANVDKHCGAGSATLTVDPFGNVLPCVQWRRVVGNVREQPIASLWTDSAPLADVRAITRDLRTTLGAMGDAAAGMAFCPGAAHTYSGDARALYPAAVERGRLEGERRVRLQLLR